MKTVFESERLLCRRWIPEDFAALYAVYSDPVGMRFVGDGLPITHAECEEWYRITQANYATRGYGMFALVERDLADCGKSHSPTERRPPLRLGPRKPRRIHRFTYVSGDQPGADADALRAKHFRHSLLGQVVGFGGLVHPGGQPEAEIKYAFLRSHWGQGLASEAVPALLAYGASQHGLRRIIATVDPEHLASQRVLTKAGMSLVEHRKESDSITLVYEWLAPGAEQPELLGNRN